MFSIMHTSDVSHLLKACYNVMPGGLCLTQVIGVIVAETEPQARRAAKAVKVDYEDLPAVISIEDAIEANSFYEKYHGDSLVSGDVEAGFEGERG